MSEKTYLLDCGHEETVRYLPGTWAGRCSTCGGNEGVDHEWAVARIAELEAERQAVLDAINLYGDSVLHGALDDIGFAPRFCLCGADLGSPECLSRAHLRGPSQAPAEAN